MIRLYLDWNVISNLKKPEFDKFQKLGNLIDKYRERIIIPFSGTHLDDLKKSYNLDGENEYFNKDIDTLSKISKNHFMQWEEDKGITYPYLATPMEVFKPKKADIECPVDIANIFNIATSTVNSSKYGRFVKNSMNLLNNTQIGSEELAKNIQQFYGVDKISNFGELLNINAEFFAKILNNKEDFLNLRNKIKEGGIEPDVNHGNWNENEIFVNIDKLLKASGLDMSFDELVEYSGKHFKNSDNVHNKFLNTYIILDMLGYKSDKLKGKNNNAYNIFNDANHSFYAAHCDFFIADDKNLVKKSKAIYFKNNLPTKVYSVDDFIKDENRIFPRLPKNRNDLLKLQIEFNNKEYFIETQEIDNQTFSIFKLPFLLFDFFNYLIVIRREDTNAFRYMFKRAYKNFSRFLFDAEIESFLKQIFDTFSILNNKHTISDVKNLIFNKDKKVILHEDKYHTIYLQKGEYKPELVYYFSEEINSFKKQQ